MNTNDKPTGFQTACALAAIFLFCAGIGMATGALIIARTDRKAAEAKERQSLANWRQTIAQFEARKATHHSVAEIEKEVGGHQVIIACRLKGMTDQAIMDEEHHLQLLGVLANIIYYDPRTPEKVRAELAAMCPQQR
jgi:hypothetical protein